MKATSSPTSTASGPSSRPGDASLSPFDYAPLNRVVYGPGTIARLGELTRELGIRRVLLVTDPGLLRVGHPQTAERLFAEAGVAAVCFDRVKENPDSRLVHEGTVFARAAAIDGIVALGGGSAMDCAKGINFLLTNGGSMADYKGFGKATQPMLPSIGIPTTSGTGSEAQCYALITDASSHLKMACGDKKAAFRICILDPELTVSQPRATTAVTGIDAVAHALESFVCTKRNAISNHFALQAWHYLEPNLERVLTVPDDLAARGAMQLGAHFAGAAIENAMLGICHSCANPLTAHYGISHGTAIGLMLPSVIRFNASAAERWYRQLLPATAGVTGQNGHTAGAILAERIEQLVRACDLPTRLRDCGVSDSILHLLAEEAAAQWTANFNPRPVTEADLLHVYEQAW